MDKVELSKKLNEMTTFEEVDTYTESVEFKSLDESLKRQVIERMADFIDHSKSLPLEELLVRAAEQEGLILSESDS